MENRAEDDFEYVAETNKNCVTQIYKLIQMKKRIEYLITLCKNCKKDNYEYLNIITKNSDGEIWDTYRDLKISLSTILTCLNDFLPPITALMNRFRIDKGVLEVIRYEERQFSIEKLYRRGYHPYEKQDVLMSTDYPLLIDVLLRYSDSIGNQYWNFHAENILNYNNLITYIKVDDVYRSRCMVWIDSFAYYRDELLITDQIKLMLITLRGIIDNINSTWIQIKNDAEADFCSAESYEWKLFTFLRIMGHSVAHPEATVTYEALHNWNEIKILKPYMRKKNIDSFDEAKKIKKIHTPEDIREQLMRYSKMLNCGEYDLVIKDNDGYTNFYYFFLSDLYNWIDILIDYSINKYAEVGKVISKNDIEDDMKKHLIYVGMRNF